VIETESKEDSTKRSIFNKNKPEEKGELCLLIRRLRDEASSGLLPSF
jgi:hypothetical protein